MAASYGEVLHYVKGILHLWPGAVRSSIPGGKVPIPLPGCCFPSPISCFGYHTHVSDGLELAEEGEGLRLEDALQEQEKDRAGDHEDQGLRETEADHGRRGPYPFIPVEATLWT